MNMFYQKCNLTMWIGWFLPAIAFILALQAAPGLCEQSLEPKPRLVLIHSQECPVCAQVMPEVHQLAAAFGQRVNFVYLDVTDSKAKAASRDLAKSLHLGAFFNLYSESFPVVGIFDRDNV